MAGSEPSNGRVTNAVLKNNQEHIIEKMDKFEKKIDDWSKRVSVLELKQGVQAEKMLSISRTSGIRDGLITFATVVGTVLGIYIGPRQ